MQRVATSSWTSRFHQVRDSAQKTWSMIRLQHSGPCLVRRPFQGVVSNIFALGSRIGRLYTTPAAVTHSPRKLFTPEEDAFIIKSRKEGVQFHAISAHLERNVSTVRGRYSQRLVYSDPSAPRMGYKNDKAIFTPADDDLIAQLHKEGKSRAEIAAALGSTVRAINTRMHGSLYKRLGLVRSWKPFTPQDDAKILELRSASTTFSLIGQNIERTEASVRNRYNLLLRQAQPHRRKPFTQSEFEQMLALQHKGLGIPQIAQSLGRNPQVIRENLHHQLLLSGTVLRKATWWLPSQTEELLRLRDNEKLSWPAIAERMPGRSAYAVQGRYRLVKSQARKKE